ncbi:ubiquitin-like modifier 1 [Schizopora paradoxa]|uniref:Ubiquitin-related modifier 1 n=1 Tax=Schizopora paradoxa TaxID=27342 RepID=A0A0H2S177_9AGAM|nr:ubiquitin-like modifier 1 [Schizopora paradoxa]
MTSSSSSTEQLKINVDFGGGLEILFDNKRSHVVSLPLRVAPSSSDTNPTDPISSSTTESATADETRPTDVSALIDHLKDNVLSDRKRAGLFAENGTVRPGVLVLINDSDWELEGEGSYVLKDGDNVSFISTLHGG